jgi:hypothetical protein
VNPFDPPLIDPGVLASDFDIFTLREALKTRSEVRFRSSVEELHYCAN